MVAIPNSVPLTGPIAPIDDTDQYPTWLARYGKGGFRSVDTYNELLAIPSLHLETGMLVKVTSTGDYYTYNGSAWVLEVFNTEGGGESYRIINGQTEVGIYNPDGTVQFKFWGDNYGTIQADNIFLGAGSGGTNLVSNVTDAVNNVCLGNYSAENITLGDGNVGIGYLSLGLLTTSIQNTALGARSLYRATTGQDNVAVGHRAGEYHNGNECILINPRTTYTFLPDYTNTNCIVIGIDSFPSTISVSNEITLGNSAITSLRCAVTSITSLSDQRDKTNIQDLTLGLDFIKQLRPVEFEWNTRDGAKVGVKDFNFIAQDLKAAQEEVNAPWLNLVLDNNPDKLEATPGRLIPILVKAIQDLEARLTQSEAEIALLKSQAA